MEAVWRPGDGGSRARGPSRKGEPYLEYYFGVGKSGVGGGGGQSLRIKCLLFILPPLPFFCFLNTMFAGSRHQSEAPTAQLERSPTQRKATPPPISTFITRAQDFKPLISVKRRGLSILKLFFMHFVPTESCELTVKFIFLKKKKKQSQSSV